MNSEEAGAAMIGAVDSGAYLLDAVCAGTSTRRGERNSLRAERPLATSGTLSRKSRNAIRAPSYLVFFLHKGPFGAYMRQPDRHQDQPMRAWRCRRARRCREGTLEPWRAPTVRVHLARHISAGHVGSLPTPYYVSLLFSTPLTQPSTLTALEDQ